MQIMKIAHDSRVSKSGTVRNIPTARPAKAPAIGKERRKIAQPTRKITHASSIPPSASGKCVFAKKTATGQVASQTINAANLMDLR